MSDQLQRLGDFFVAQAITAKGLIINLILIGGLMSTASAQEEPQFVPVLTPDAARIFAEMPDTSVEIPEVYELLTIAISVANIEDFLGDLIPEGESADGFMIDKSTPYYEDVEAQFGDHRDHPLIAKIRETFPPMIETFNIPGLLTYRNQSLRYRFDEEGLVSNDLYIPISEAPLTEFPELEALVTSLPFDIDDSETLSQIEDFAEKTNFRQFYKEHQDYYDARSELATDLCNVGAARDWLAAQFPAAYNNHTIVLSPLVGGTHNFFPTSTPDESVTQALMFVSIFKGDAETAADVSLEDQVAYCRKSFTEIDHGYVNPATDLYAEEVDEAMPDITPWNSDETNQGVYSTPYDTFNEYMTHGAYSLFLSETLSTEELENAISYQENFMVNDRGFVKYPEFNRELLRLYQEREEGQTVTNLYPAVLEWVAAQTQ